MDKNEIRENNSLQNFLTDLVRRVEDIRRWKRYPHNYKQTVLGHTLETALLAQIVIAIEQTAGAQFDAYLLLSTAVNHDLGEGIIGDISYSIKNDPRVKAMIELIEKEQFELMFAALDFGPYSQAVANMFSRSFAVQENASTVEGALFNAIEKIGYVIFALREIDEGNGVFVQVLNNHHKDLVAYSERFPSIKLIYGECLEHMKHIGTSVLLQYKFDLSWLGYIVHNTPDESEI